MLKSMSYLSFAIVAAALGCAAVPAAAQVGGFDGYAFVDAVKKKTGDKVMELIRKNGPGIVNAKDASGNTALIVAITDRNEDYTAFLLNQGADPNLGGKGGDTPLIAAARVGYDEAAEWLLGQGAKVDGANRMGETPLIIAVQQRQKAMVQLLLSAGANPDKTDNAAGLSARDYATRDTRSRDILQTIEAKKPKAAAASR
jgi:ankyrin repeat protein